MGPIDSPAVTDFIESVDWVIPSDHRDFSRSTPDWAISFPRDSGLTDDGQDPFIVQVQTAMKNNPISFPYAGPIDGKKSGTWYKHLKNVLIQFGWALEKKFPGKKIPTIVQGNKINPGALTEALLLLNPKNKEDKDKDKDKDEKEKDVIESDSVKSFQDFLSKSQPVIGQLYTGPVDGIINDKLVDAAKAVETAIANATGDDSVAGKLYSGGAFNTTIYDLENALNLIQEHRGKEKTSFLDTKGRILAFSSILNA